MKLNEMLKQDNIIMSLNAETKEDAIKEICCTLKENGYVSDADLFYKDVIDRENQVSTGIGNEIAIPHGKSDSVIESTAVIAKSSNGIEWEGLDEKKVKLVILLAISNDKNSVETGHLKILSKIAVMLMDEDFVDEVKASEDKSHLYKLFINKGEDNNE